MWRHRWALLSGFLGASASCMIKMGISTDKHSPLQYFQDVCEQQPWMVDLDETLLRWIHKVLGDLMIKRRLNLMKAWTLMRKVIEDLVLKVNLFDVDYCQALVLPVRLFCVMGMVILNAYMIATFLQGMRESGSVVATSLSTAANFTASALYGALIWKERINGQWCIGFTSVLLGVVLLSNISQPQDLSTKKMKLKDSSYVIIGKQNQTIQSTTTRPTSVIKTPRANVEVGMVASMRSFYTQPQSSSNETTNSIPGSTPRRRFKEKAVQQQNNVATTPPRMLEKVKCSIPTKTKSSDLKAESSLIRFHDTPSIKTHGNQLIDCGLLNECALCDGIIFDKTTGECVDSVAADLSPNTCFHIFHAKCLKQSSKSFGNACPICGKPLAMWTTAKQAAHFPGFWLHRVLQYLLSMKEVPRDPSTGNAMCLPASVIRENFSNDTSLTAAQKNFIDDDPSGMGKGLQASLEWGGYRDYNTVPKGHLGFYECLRTKGLWKYDLKKDDIWLWAWGDVHPRQRCDQCQMMKRPLSVQCQGCRGSSEAARYCSESCSKRDWQRHKQICQEWKNHGPSSS